MSEPEQTHSPIKRSVRDDGNRQEQKPFAAQMAALRERIVKMAASGIESSEPASIFKVRED